MMKKAKHSDGDTMVSIFKRKYFLILLALLIIYNLSGGLLPGQSIVLSNDFQNIIAYGTGLITACVFPLFFYKTVGIENLISYAKYCGLIILLFPFLVFLWVIYPIEKDLEVRHLAQVLVTNAGFVVVMLLFLGNIIQEHKKALEILNLLRNESPRERVIKNCVHYGLTSREIEVCELAIAGHTYKEIGEILFISDRTVNKHMQNIFKKSQSKNKVDLLYRIKGFSII